VDVFFIFQGLLSCTCLIDCLIFCCLMNLDHLQLPADVQQKLYTGKRLLKFLNECSESTKQHRKTVLSVINSDPLKRAGANI